MKKAYFLSWLIVLSLCIVQCRRKNDKALPLIETPLKSRVDICYHGTGERLPSYLSAKPEFYNFHPPFPKLFVPTGFIGSLMPYPIYRQVSYTKHKFPLYRSNGKEAKWPIIIH